MCDILILPFEDDWAITRQLEIGGRDIHRVANRFYIARPHDPELIERECRAALRRVSGYHDVPPSAA